MRWMWMRREWNNHSGRSFYLILRSVSGWNDQRSIFRRLICVPEYKLGCKKKRERNRATGEGWAKTECHFLLTNSPRRLFFIPPLLPVIAQSSRIHLTGHFPLRFPLTSVPCLSGGALLLLFPQLPPAILLYFPTWQKPPRLRFVHLIVCTKPVPGFTGENRKTNSEVNNESWPQTLAAVVKRRHFSVLWKHWRRLNAIVSRPCTF